MDPRTRLVLDLFQGVPEPLAVMGIAALPIAELRLAIPVAIGVYGMHPAVAFGYAVLGNMIPVPIILLFFRWARDLLLEVWPFSVVLRRVHHKIELKRESFERYGPPALISFVGIPLPMTGAWTGSAAATVFEVPFLPAMAMLGVGVLIAGGIVTALTVAGVVVAGG